MKVVLQGVALRQVERERTWLHNNRGRERADAFEAELRHALELIAELPDMGDAPEPEHPDRRHWYLRRSGFHVYYRIFRDTQRIRVVAIRHEKQRPLKR